MDEPIWSCHSIERVDNAVFIPVLRYFLANTLQSYFNGLVVIYYFMGLSVVGSDTNLKVTLAVGSCDYLSNWKTLQFSFDFSVLESDDTVIFLKHVSYERIYRLALKFV